MWYFHHKLSEGALPLTMGEVKNKSLPVGGSSTGMVNRPQLSLLVQDILSCSNTRLLENRAVGYELVKVAA